MESNKYQAPNSISPEELQALLDIRQEEEELSDIPQLSWEEMVVAAKEHSMAFFKKTGTPLAMKALLLQTLNDMILWHHRMASLAHEEMGTDSSTAWLLDAGNLEAQRRLLIDIEVTNEDPTPGWKRPDNGFGHKK